MKPAEGGIESGTVVADKYRIESVLGRGGMGMVYRARHLALEEDVAIKVLRRDVSLDPETVQRFVREAQSAVKLKSEHVARIKDVGALDDGLPYIVMEFLEGADLGQMVDAHGAMAVPIAVDLVLQACDALVEAHSLGIVHRDVKPTNLFVSFRPDQSAIVKVLDFGISKSGNGSDMSLTQTQSMLGTPAYMSPEQMRSARNVDARTDIWSLGTVLYELVEARRPFEAQSFSEMCVMVAVDAPQRMTNAIDLEPVILRCLQKQPADRYAHVGELMRELAAYAGNREAANHYIKRAYRMLGLKVPLSLDSNPAIRPLIPGPTRSEVHDAASAALLAHNTPPSGVRTYAPTVGAPTVPRLEKRGGTIAFFTLAVLIGVGAAIGIMATIGDESDDAPARGTAQQVVEPGSAGSAIDPAPVTTGSATEPAPVAAGSAGSATEASPAAPTVATGSPDGVGIGSAKPAGNGSGQVAANPPTRPPVRPPVRARPPKPPATTATTPSPAPPVKPPDKPKFDPFAAPRAPKP
ncbi:MAG: protein kinase [Deltaproteobacteria bacterium]|nr:protein kinase [Deltaproteobacteria bacterium]